MKSNRRLWPLILLCVVLVSYVVIWTNRNTILDWAALQGYTPSSQMTALASDTTMTPLAKRYLDVNHAKLADRDEFNKHCTNETEQTVVLGCYTGNRNGIYVYNVTASELHGVQQVTAAHEMLHQAYDRLSNSERGRIDKLIEDYYKTSLNDDSVKAQIEEYKQSEPDALDNEMHSLFGTEVASLPSELEEYYKQYFTDRAKVVQYYNDYQSAFTTRKAQIANYDEQLKTKKEAIDTLEADVHSELSSLDSQKAQMEAKRASGDTSGYNAMVAPYNAAIAAYNADLGKLKAMISEYNDIVTKRNAIADQEAALQQSLSSKQLPEQAGQ